MRLVDPLHAWQVGRGKRRSSVSLTLPDAGFCAEYAKRNVLLFLTELWVPHLARGQGYGHSLLRAVTTWADESGTDLCLYCAPYGGLPHPTQTDLATFYAKHGFRRMKQRDPDIEMVRRARARH